MLDDIKWIKPFFMSYNIQAAQRLNKKIIMQTKKGKDKIVKIDVCVLDLALLQGLVEFSTLNAKPYWMSKTEAWYEVTYEQIMDFFPILGINEKEFNTLMWRLDQFGLLQVRELTDVTTKTFIYYYGDNYDSLTLGQY